MGNIDFVVTWVDGNDPQWLAERQQYVQKKEKTQTAGSRYRDWDLMRYWFRGVEKFAPWVNKVYFITCGHYPQWLDLEHPKLVHIKHTDYIPQECLPTYNSNVIEQYIHKIPGLSDTFVLFNDDMFLIKPVVESEFFCQGMPCESALMGTVSCRNPDEIIPHTLLNNSALLNKYFSKKEVLKKHWTKFFSLSYGKNLLRSLYVLPFSRFLGFVDTHLPTPHLKKTFEEIWEKEPELYAKNGKNRFRSKDDLSHFVMKNWQFCKGEFVPRSINWGKFFIINDPAAANAIQKQKYKAVCLNDTINEIDFEKSRERIAGAFEAILPEKSSFEKE